MRRTRAPGAGNARELACMAVLADDGWLCASRRHIGGPGDILAVRKTRVSNMLYTLEARLIEVKSTAGGPYERFGPQDRQAMVETSAEVGAEPWLAWWPARGKLRWIGALEWPKAQPEVELPTLEEARAEHARAVIERQDNWDGNAP